MSIRYLITQYSWIATGMGTQQIIGELDQKRMKLEDELREVEKQARRQLTSRSCCFRNIHFTKTHTHTRGPVRARSRPVHTALSGLKVLVFCNSGAAGVQP